MMHGQYWDMGWTVIWGVWVMGMLLFLAIYLFLNDSKSFARAGAGKFRKRMHRKQHGQGEMSVES
ncbi:hypothetical protein CLV98_107171 [Dyadobacter jejuensis]|uniref:Heme exporter protein D n=1 Tax=Dyadobacter jejuensis TaxID=1082580 RepID=A0A316AID5_9BACT|nr:hypothetical protein [Dyadobacter jejuensis]PWJ57463.1 hypothetical protein CLV98_107171 [Dyadobacter jejuensis]